MAPQEHTSDRWHEAAAQLAAVLAAEQLDRHAARVSVLDDYRTGGVRA